MTSGPKSNFTCLRVTLFETGSRFLFYGCSEVNSTWLITSELTNQRARKALFTCVVYTETLNPPYKSILKLVSCKFF